MTYHPNKFRANVDNKPHVSNSNSQRFTAFDLRFDSSGDLNDHTNYLVGLIMKTQVQQYALYQQQMMLMML